MGEGTAKEYHCMFYKKTLRRTTAAHHTVMKLDVFVQKMKLLVQPLGIRIIWMAAFAWTSNTPVRWS